MRSGFRPTVPFVVLALLIVGARSLSAQAVAPPQPSVLWTSVPVTAHANAVPSKGATQRRHALIGALVGLAVGGVAGHAICTRYYAGTDGCTGQTLWWGTVGGALGLLIGASAGREADR